jgi:aspartyl-tRNA(Asn)/glutamyl-tRNA(Gln) amidotransferase subunit A
MADWTLCSLAEAIRQRRVSAAEIMEECLRKIQQSKLNAFISVASEEALTSAREMDAELSRGQIRGPLHGVPIGYKDLFFIDGMPASCGTAKSDYFISDRTATVVSRLEAVGAITVGKLNMTELAMSPFGDNASFGDVRNPWAEDRCAGGSSSGSAAAIAGGLLTGALGSDTGGSIRQPAAYCGVVGLKPTLGRVSRAGAMPLSWSLDHVGPLGRTVRDVALLLSQMAGQDDFDRSTSAIPVADYVREVDGRIDGLKIGIPKNYYWDGVHPDLRSSVLAAADALGRLGCVLTEIDLPDPKAINSISSLITRSEGCAAHGAFAEKHPDTLSPAINGRLKLGYQVSAYHYLQAQRLRGQLTQEFVHDVFGKVDMVITPVAPDVAPKLRDMTTGKIDVVLERMGQLTSMTRPANGLGLPAISVPCGFSASGLPFAFQLIGRPFDEASLLRVGHRYEQSFDWWLRRPAT